MKKIPLIVSIILNVGLVVLFFMKWDDIMQSKQGEIAISRHQTLIGEAHNNIQHYADSCFTLFNRDSAGNEIPNPNYNFIRSYTISDTDLLSVLGLPITTKCTKHCRVYLGIDPGNQFKLYLTPVSVTGNDSLLVNSAGNQYVLDLNAPCPSTCGSNALLNPKAKFLKP